MPQRAKGSLPVEPPRSSLAAWPAQQLGSQGAAVVGQAKQVSATNANLPYLVVYFEMTMERKFAG